MKWLMLIMAVYILALSCVPCFCDDMQDIAGTAQEVAAAPHPEEDHGDDNCNPFFACNCCPSTAFFYQRTFHITEPVAVSNAIPFAITDQSFISYNSRTIWQPPKA